MNKLLSVGLIFLLGLSSCCDNDLARETGPYQQVKVLFDTSGINGCKKTDIDSVFVSFKRNFQDSVYPFSWKIGKFMDTFYNNGKGGFTYKNITYSELIIGLNKNITDSVFIFAGSKTFLFSNLHLVLEQTGDCKKKLVTKQHDVNLNNNLFNLENSELKIGDILYKEGVFYLK